MNARSLSLATVLLLSPAVLSLPTRAAEAAVPADAMADATDIIGQKALSTTGQDLGEVHDLVVSPNGRVVYVLVASGGILGFGDTLRAVPYSAVTSTGMPGSRVVAVDLHGADWIRAPRARIDQLDTLGAKQRGKEMFKYYTLDWPSDLGGDRLLLASQIDDAEVTRDGHHVGAIEDVLVYRGRVVPVLKADPVFGGAGRSYAISLDQLSWPTPRSHVASTTLTPADLDRAQPLRSTTAFADTDHYVWAYTPPGRVPAPIVTSSSVMTTTGDRKTVEQVRRSLETDPALSAALSDVRFAERDGRLVITGRVPSADLKDRIVSRTRDAAQGWTVDNELTVWSAAATE